MDGPNATTMGIATEPSKNLVDGGSDARIIGWDSQLHQRHKAPVRTCPLLVWMYTKSSVGPLSS